jgi:hypothetical protein
MLPTDKYNDKDYRRFVDQLLFATERKQEILQRALFSTILRKILSSHHEAEYELLPINMRSSNKLDLVLHIFWYCLWCFKWLLYFRHTRKESVKLLEHIPYSDVIRLMKVCDYFLLTSRNVIFDLVVIEALASGMCVYVSDDGRNREIINDGINGYLLQTNNEYLVAKIKSIMLLLA